MDKHLKEQILNKRMLFTVTTGRSGTKYLSYLLSLLKNVHSEHEAEPAFDDYYRGILNGQDSYERFWSELKLPHISSTTGSVYADVSHVACKGFLEYLWDQDIYPSLIILRRDKRSVAKSLHRLNTIPGRSKLGLKYLNAPYDKDVLALDIDWQTLTDYQLCYWYTLEIERRQNLYKKLYLKQNKHFVDVEFESLTNGSGFTEIIKKLELPKFSFLGYLKYIKNRNKRINQKSNRPKFVYSEELTKLEKRVKKLIIT